MACCVIWLHMYIRTVFFSQQVVASQLAMNKKKAVGLLQHVAAVNVCRKIFKLWLESTRITSQSRKWFRVNALSSVPKSPNCSICSSRAWVPPYGIIFTLLLTESWTWGRRGQGQQCLVLQWRGRPYLITTHWSVNQSMRNCSRCLVFCAYSRGVRSSLPLPLQIFSMAGLTCALCCASVCRSWKEIIDDPLMWNRVCCNVIAVLLLLLFSGLHL